MRLERFYYYEQAQISTSWLTLFDTATIHCRRHVPVMNRRTVIGAFKGERGIDG